MTGWHHDLAPIMSSLLRRTRAVLLSTAAINVDAVEHFNGDAGDLDLHHVTAIAGFGAPLSVRTAFCFDRTLLDALFGRITADLSIPKGQEEVFTHDVAAEVANMVQGLCSADFPARDHALSLRPPVLLLGECHIDRPRDAFFGSMRLRTPNGLLSIHLIQPESLLDDQLRHMNH